MQAQVLAGKSMPTQPIVNLRKLLRFVQPDVLEGLIVAIISVQHFYERQSVQSFLSIIFIQYCQQRHFQESTLYFAKIYLKMFIVENQGI